MSPQPLELNTDCRPRSTEGLPYWRALVGLGLTGSAVQTGPRFTSVLCLFPAGQLRFVISLHQLPGCGFEGLGVRLGQKWSSLRPQSRHQAHLRLGESW